MAQPGLTYVDATGGLVAFGNFTLVVDSGGGGGGGDASSLFSQTQAVTVSNTGTETTLIGTGAGSVTIGANTWSAGEVLDGTAQGVFSTRAASTGYADVELSAGATSLFTIRINLSDIQANQPWRLDYHLVRISTGGSGTVRGTAWLKYGEESSAAIEVGAGHSAPVTLASDADQALNVTADWQNGDTGNIWTCYLHVFTIIATSS